MIKKIIKYKINVFLAIGIIIFLTLTILFYTGPKEGYQNIFLLFITLSPFLFIAIRKNNIVVDLAFCISLLFIIILFAVGLWEYKDRININLTPEEFGSQFSFENPLLIWLLITCGSVSLLISAIIRMLFSKSRQLFTASRR